MKINKKIIKVGIERVNMGKIAMWKDFVFLFDALEPGLIQLSPAYELMGRKRLEKVKKMDAVFFDENILLISDSTSNRTHHWKLKIDTGDGITLSEYTDYPLPQNSTITSIATMNNHYLLLDKNSCMIRVYDGDFNEIKTVGSRMGYMYDEAEEQRLGFEFPEDIMTAGNRVIVSDSGNQRLVVICVTGDEWKQEKTIKLPEFPYKFIFYDKERDLVVVSDFDRSLMAVSLTYGFIGRYELDYPVDFYPSWCDGQRSIVGSEHCDGAEIELVELMRPEIPVELVAKDASNSKVLMRALIDGDRLEEARQIALGEEELLPEYAKYAPSDADNIGVTLTAYIEKTIHAVIDRDETLKKEIAELSVDFIKKYKSIPESSDKEAANIDKENIRHRMFLHLKEYRSQLKKIVYIKNAIRRHQGLLEHLNRMLEERFTAVRQGITANINEIENNLLEFNELSFLEAVVDYWLFSEEENVLFKEMGLKYEKLFKAEFLLAILNDFYYHIAELFLKRGKIEQYISFADREITMYNDKMGIFKKFVHRLLQLKKYDDVLRMLDKFPDKNKEDVNYYYYRVYLAKRDMDKAFSHLKKELDLYAHRIDLIPQLIKLNKLKREEAEAFIDKILQKSGQSIDVYLNTAKAFQGIGDIRAAEVYIDKELCYFPENQNAVSFKLDLLMNRLDSKGLENLVTSLTSPQFSLQRSRVYFILEDFETSWTNFRDYILENTIENSALVNIFLFKSLNYLSFSQAAIHQLWEMANRVLFEDYKKECLVYLSFLKHYAKKDAGGVTDEAEVFDVEVYLSAYSTGILAYNYFFDRVKQLKEENKWDELFLLVEKILRFNPGDKEIFKFLDSLVGDKASVK